MVAPAACPCGRPGLSLGWCILCRCACVRRESTPRLDRGLPRRVDRGRLYLNAPGSFCGLCFLSVARPGSCLNTGRAVVLPSEPVTRPGCMTPAGGRSAVRQWPVQGDRTGLLPPRVLSSPNRELRPWVPGAVSGGIVLLGLPVQDSNAGKPAHEKKKGTAPWPSGLAVIPSSPSAADRAFPLRSGSSRCCSSSDSSEAAAGVQPSSADRVVNGDPSCEPSGARSGG